MIHTIRTVTVSDNESIIDNPIVLYRGDREVEIQFTILESSYTFNDDNNLIKSSNASHGQLVLNTPTGENMFSEISKCYDGHVVFIITKEMIDEMQEVGFYSFQIRLYDADQTSRITIPPVFNGLDIRNPIAAEDETNVVDQGIVDYARIYSDQSDEELPTFDWTGAYNKTEWVHHDVITENKLNKIEDALYSINANVRESDVVMLNTLDQVKKDADAYVKEHMAEVEADVDEFERNLNTEVETFKVDTNAAMTAHKNEVSDNVNRINDELEHINIAISKRANNEEDDTARLQTAIDNATTGAKTVLISEDFIVTGLRLRDGITLKGNGGSITWKGGTCVDETGSYYFINAMDVNNVTIDSVVLNGNQANNPYHKVADIITIGGENNKVINCTILDSPDSGIMFSGAKNSEIRGNRIDNCPDLGIYVNDGTGENHYENIISNNKITRCQHGGIGCKRITQRMIITNNMIYNCGNGITLENASTTTDFSKNMVIVNNVLRRIGFNYEAAKRGINLRGSHNTIVNSNKIEECEGPCIYLEGSDNCVITDNILIGGDDANSTNNMGIQFVDRDNQGCNYNTISSNVISNIQGKGIWCNTINDSKYNVIKNNIINTPNGVALRLEKTLSESIIQSNICNGVYDYVDYGCVNCIISDNKFVNNTISSNAGSSVRTSIYSFQSGSVANIVSYSNTGCPTSGDWNKEDMVYNQETSIIGVVPNQYFILGWKRLTSGDTHVVGTDWQEIRIYIQDKIQYESRISNIGNPTTIFTPKYIGEEVIDAINKRIYKAIGLTSSDWVEIATYN